jgi:hypothetical protein
MSINGLLHTYNATENLDLLIILLAFMLQAVTIYFLVVNCLSHSCYDLLRPIHSY